MPVITRKLNPIPHGVFWITHTCLLDNTHMPAPCNTAILKDMDLKFRMLKYLSSYCLFKTVKKFMQIS